MIVALVPPAQVPLLAPAFVRYLEPAARYTYGRYEVSDWLQAAMEDMLQTWVVFEKDGDPLDPDLVILTEIVSYPRLRALRVVAPGGRKFIAALPAICDTILAGFGIDAGCTRWEGLGRKGWTKVARMYDDEIHDLVFVEGAIHGRWVPTAGAADVSDDHAD